MTGMELFEKMDVIEDQYIEESMTEEVTFGKKKKRSWIWIATSVAAAFVLTFIGVINAFPNVAVAMNDVVGLKELVQLVTVDKSMKACLENEYAQYIGEEQIMKDGHYSKVYYIVADKTHISIFYKTDVPYKGAEYHHFANVLSADESPIVSIWSVNSFETDIEDLYELRITFLEELEEDRLPESIQMVIDFGKTWEDGYATEEGGFIQQPEATATYEIQLDNVFSVDSVMYENSKEVEIDGQKILFECVEVYPTRTRLVFYGKEENTKELLGLHAVLLDQKENEYQPLSEQEGVQYLNDESNLNITKQYQDYDTSFFSKINTFQVEIRGVWWKYVSPIEQEVSYEKKSVGELPEGMELLKMEMDEEKTVTIQFREYSTDLLSCTSDVYDAETGDACDREVVLDGDSYVIVTYKIPNYWEGKCKFRWERSEDITLEKPIRVKMQ